jgi:transposase
MMLSQTGVQRNRVRFTGSYTDRALIAFLRDLRHHFRRQAVILIWDGLPAHRSRAMRAYLAHQRRWLTVERLPGYAPELNPVELVWGNVKRTELANLCTAHVDALRAPLRRGCARVRRHPHLAFNFLRHDRRGEGEDAATGTEAGSCLWLGHECRESLGTRGVPPGAGPRPARRGVGAQRIVRPLDRPVRAVRGPRESGRSRETAPMSFGQEEVVR